MSQVIVFTSANVQNDGTNSNLVLNFPLSATFKDTEMALSVANFYYACYNITSAFNNNSFTYTWTVAGVTTPFTVTFPNGMYQYADLNNYWQSVMIANGHYLVNASGQNVYYCELLSSMVNYSVNINTYAVPVSLPSGWSQPSNFTGFPTTTCNPIVTFPSTNTFYSVVGYVGNFSTSANSGVGTTLSYNSSTTPQITSNPNFFITCDLVMNKLQTPSNIIHNIVPTGNFGSLVKEAVNVPVFIPLTNGTYNSIRIGILGSNRQPVQMLDPNMSFVFLIRQKQK